MAAPDQSAEQVFSFADRTNLDEEAAGKLVGPVKEATGQSIEAHSLMGEKSPPKLHPQDNITELIAPTPVDENEDEIPQTPDSYKGNSPIKIFEPVTGSNSGESTGSFANSVINQRLQKTGQKAA